MFDQEEASSFSPNRSPLTNIRGIAQHGEAQGPLDGQAANDEGGNENTADDNGRVDGAQRNCAQAILGVYGGLQVGRALEGCELDHEGKGHDADVLEDSPFLAGRQFDLLSVGGRVKVLVLIIVGRSHSHLGGLCVSGMRSGAAETTAAVQ